MTQGAECEKTRAPNYLFARMRKNGDDKREGRELCRTSGLRRRLVRNTTHRDIQTQPPPLFFFTQYIDDTLLFFHNSFSSGVLVQRLKTAWICCSAKTCLVVFSVSFQPFPSEVAAANHLPPPHSLLSHQLTLHPILLHP